MYLNKTAKILMSGLALSFAATAIAQGGTYSFEYDGKTLFGTRELQGVQILGTYMYDNFGRPTEPRVELRANGEGCWANHGRPCKRIEWWLEATEDGVAKQQEAGGRIFATFLMRHLEDAGAKKAGDYSGYLLMVDPANRQIMIAGERIKPM